MLSAKMGQVGYGDYFPPYKTKMRYWVGLTSPGTGFTTIAQGTVVAIDRGGNGAATIGGTTRSAVAGSPAYTVDGTIDDLRANVIKHDSNSATLDLRVTSAIYVDSASLASGSVGTFALSGDVKALVSGRTTAGASGALAVGERLTIASESGYEGSLRRAVADELVVATLMEAQTSGTTSLKLVRFIGGISHAGQARTAGAA